MRIRRRAEALAQRNFARAVPPRVAAPPPACAVAEAHMPHTHVAANRSVNTHNHDTVAGCDRVEQPRRRTGAGGAQRDLRVVVEAMNWPGTNGAHPSGHTFGVVTLDVLRVCSVLSAKPFVHAINEACWRVANDTREHNCGPPHAHQG